MSQSNGFVQPFATYPGQWLYNWHFDWMVLGSGSCQAARGRQADTGWGGLGAVQRKRSGPQRILADLSCPQTALSSPVSAGDAGFLGALAPSSEKVLKCMVMPQENGTIRDQFQSFEMEGGGKQFFQMHTLCKQYSGTQNILDQWPLLSLSDSGVISGSERLCDVFKIKTHNRGGGAGIQIQTCPSRKDRG